MMWFSPLSSLFGALLSLGAPKRDPRQRVTALYQQYGYVLKRRCRRILRDEALVDDAMQEIFITLCRCHDQYRGDPQKILSWLYRITTTHCLQMLDKNRRWSRNLEEMVLQYQEREMLDRHEPDTEAHVVVDDFLRTLPESERAAVLYRYISGMTQEEIAEVMEVGRDQVRRWLKHFQARGRVVFRERGKV